MLKKWISKLIGRIKRQEYSIDESISDLDTVSLLGRRFCQAFRGIFLRIGIGGRGIIFRGRNVKIFHKGKLKAGNNLIIGDYSMIDALSRHGIEFGNSVTIGRNVSIRCTGVIRNLGEGIKCGNNVAFGDNTIVAAMGGITIGNDTIMGPNVVINAENHIYTDRSVPVRLQGESRKGICIGENCWVGAGAIILDGVTIGNHCVVGAGAVVTKSFDDDVVIAGVPARIIKRTDQS